jgi:hypothetical protein
MTHEWITRIVEAVFDKALMEFMDRFKNIEQKTADELERLVRTSTSFLEDSLMRDCLPIFEVSHENCL